jgi:hypothetical protein
MEQLPPAHENTSQAPFKQVVSLPVLVRPQQGAQQGTSSAPISFAETVDGSDETILRIINRTKVMAVCLFMEDPQKTMSYFIRSAWKDWERQLRRKSPA